MSALSFPYQISDFGGGLAYYYPLMAASRLAMKLCNSALVRGRFQLAISNKSLFVTGSMSICSVSVAVGFMVVAFFVFYYLMYVLKHKRFKKSIVSDHNL